MALVMSGASDFDAFGPVSASVLHPWLVFGEQATMDSELYALGKAIEAVTWEWQAAWHGSQAAWWLGIGLPESVAQAMSQLQEVGRNIRRASSAWGKAIDWLKESGDPHKAPVYQSLYQHVLAQQQRLDQQCEHLRRRVVLLCQEWGIALAAVPDLSEEGGDGC